MSSNSSSSSVAEPESGDSGSTSSTTTTSSSRPVSLLDRLRSPTAADINRKRKIKSNSPPVGTRHCKGTTSSDPKSVEPSKRVKDFPGECLNVSAGKLFCSACREELSLKRSTVTNHVRSQKHETSKKNLQKKEAREKDIADALKKHNEEVHLHGESLPESQQVYRVKVVRAFLRSGIPLTKLDTFRDVLEEHAYRLCHHRHMFDLVPFILKDEDSRIRGEISGKYLSVIFDGTSRLGEVLAIVLRYIDDNWIVQQRLIRMEMLSKSMTGEEIARELVSVLSVTYGVDSKFLLAAMRDGASVNNLAMKTVKIIYPYLVDIRCFSHALCLVGQKFCTPNLTEFMHLWITLFSHSPKTKFLWKTTVGRSMASYSPTRWWSKWEVVKMVMTYFGDVESFLTQNDDIGPATRPKLISLLANPQKKGLLQLEMAATVDWGEPFVKACYTLEGDGPLALECHEVIEKVSASIHTAYTPNVHAIAQRLSGTPPSDPNHQQLVAYANNCVQPGLEYYKRQVETSMKASLDAFKCAKLFTPQNMYQMKPDADALGQSLTSVPFLSSPEVISSLKAELPAFIARAADTESGFTST